VKMSVTPVTQLVSRVWHAGRPVDIGATLAPLRRGAGDPTHVVDSAGALWRTSWTPDGPGTLRLAGLAGAVTATAWGAGAEWLLAGVPELLGGSDDPVGFVPPPGPLADTARRYPGLRVPRTRRVFEALVPAVLEQKVTGMEARRSWRELLYRFGEPAPGPGPAALRVPPPPSRWAELPSWEWHLAGVDSKRARTIRTAAEVAGRLEEATGMPPAAAARRLQAGPGVGAWTAAEVAQRALGDADAVSVGDYHLPALVGWALTGRRVDDEGMLELLAPYRPHRYRLVRLIELSGIRVPRRGPRLPVRDYRRL
jgi:3-methyladenine DNA glycosylase/8-oxoguanine DNA glycosylase